MAKMSNKSAPPVSKWGSTSSSPVASPSSSPTRESKADVKQERKTIVNVSSPHRDTKVESPQKPAIPTKKKKKEVIYVAIDDYTGGGEGELTFKHGDRIKILEQDPSGWWTGVLGNKIGYVPNTYLELAP